MIIQFHGVEAIKDRYPPFKRNKEWGQYPPAPPIYNAGVAQLDRAVAYEAKGWGFESLLLYHFQWPGNLTEECVPD